MSKGKINKFAGHVSGEFFSPDASKISFDPVQIECRDEGVYVSSKFRIYLVKDNGEVGDTLVSETDRVRVWHIHAKPGDRLKVHTHVLDYFWTIHAPGRARNHQPDGTFFDMEIPGAGYLGDDFRP